MCSLTMRAQILTTCYTIHEYLLLFQFLKASYFICQLFQTSKHTVIHFSVTLSCFLEFLEEN